MEQKLTDIFKQLTKRLGNMCISDKRKLRCINNIKQLQDKYSKLVISDDHKAVYSSLLKRGNELLKGKSIKDIKSVEYYLRYCNAAIYDFNDDIRPLNKIVKSYLITCALFLVLSPQYFSYILPLLFAVPIFVGLKGMKQRNYNGLLIGASVVPMGILTAIVWIKNAFLAAKDFNAFFKAMAEQYKLSYTLAQNITIICTLLSIVLLMGSVTMLINAYKYRRMFV